MSQLAVSGFAGDAELLLALVQRQQIDLCSLDLAALIAQLVAAVTAEDGGPLSQRASWAVTGAELLRLRSALLLPSSDQRQSQAERVASRLQQTLQARAEALALAAWLAARAAAQAPTWARGGAEPTRPALRSEDPLQFLWGCVGVFSGFGVQGEDETSVERSVIDPLPFWRPDQALARVREVLAAPPHEATLPSLLPAEPAAPAADPDRRLRRRAGWASTFLACLELAREGAVTLDALPPADGSVFVTTTTRSDRGPGLAPAVGEQDGELPSGRVG